MVITTRAVVRVITITITITMTTTMTTIIIKRIMILIIKNLPINMNLQKYIPIVEYVILVMQINMVGNLIIRNKLYRN